MNDADNAYIEILKAGLLVLRDASFDRDLAWCVAESEHLHNIPSLIGESNVERHRYYLGCERTAYIEWVLSQKNPAVMTNIKLRYLEPWKALEKAFNWKECIGDDRLKEPKA